MQKYRLPGRSNLHGGMENPKRQRRLTWHLEGPVIREQIGTQVVLFAASSVPPAGPDR